MIFLNQRHWPSSADSLTRLFIHRGTWKAAVWVGGAVHLQDRPHEKVWPNHTCQHHDAGPLFKMDALPFFFNLLFMIVTHREREAETQAEGEAGSMQGA